IRMKATTTKPKSVRVATIARSRARKTGKVSAVVAAVVAAVATGLTSVKTVRKAAKTRPRTRSRHRTPTLTRKRATTGQRNVAAAADVAGAGVTRTAKR